MRPSVLLKLLHDTAWSGWTEVIPDHLQFSAYCSPHPVAPRASWLIHLAALIFWGHCKIRNIPLWNQCFMSRSWHSKCYFCCNNSLAVHNRNVTYLSLEVCFFQVCALFHSHHFCWMGAMIVATPSKKKVCFWSELNKQIRTFLVLIHLKKLNKIK